jgi:uncharacterized protein DUF3617
LTLTREIIDARRGRAIAGGAPALIYTTCAPGDAGGPRARFHAGGDLCRMRRKRKGPAPRPVPPTDDLGGQPMTMPSFLRVAACAALSIALAPRAHAATAAAAREPGDMWEVTSRMSMAGVPMQMPAQTHKVCSPKTWTEPPGAKADERCETLDFRNTPTKSTWKMRCPGPPAMTGEGEITRTGTDAWTGTMKLTSDEGAMTMTLTGRRVGDCDAAAERKAVAQQQAQVENTMKQAEDQKKAMLAQSCTAVGESLDLNQVKMMAATCDPATLKAAFCKKLATQEGFVTVCGKDSQAPTNLADAAAYCGIDPDTIRNPLCEDALKKEDLKFLGHCCPVQAQALAQRECAGRDYTALAGSKYRDFCVTYARETMSEGKGAAPEAAPSETKKKKGFKIPWPH